MAEYKTWTKNWANIPAADKTLAQAQFWLKSAVTYPLLSKLGIWYANVSASSVAAERVFGKMRAMEAPNRLSMLPETMAYQLFFSVNTWAADKALKDAYERL